MKNRTENNEVADLGPNTSINILNVNYQITPEIGRMD